MSASGFTLSKEERISGKMLIDRLFTGGSSHSMAVFPVRLVYRVNERKDEEPIGRILVSVPKRCFKRAVHRNHIKRQVREAFRHHKHLLEGKGSNGFDMAFIWLSNRIYSSAEVEKCVVELLTRMMRKV